MVEQIIEPYLQGPEVALPSEPWLVLKLLTSSS